MIAYMISNRQLTPCVLLWSPSGEADQGTPLRADTFAAPRRAGRSPRWAGMGTPSHLPGHHADTACRRQQTVYAPRLGTQNSLTDYRRTKDESLSTGANNAAWVLSESNPKDYPDGHGTIHRFCQSSWYRLVNCKMPTANRSRRFP